MPTQPSSHFISYPRNATISAQTVVRQRSGHVVCPESDRRARRRPRSHPWLACSVVLLLISLPGVSHADDHVTLFSAHDDVQTLGETLSYFEDPSGALDIDAVAASETFQVSTDEVPNFGFTESAYWFRFTIQTRDITSALILELAYPLLDDVRLYTPSSNGFVETRSGDHLPFSERARDFRTFTFELNPPPDAPTTYYLRLQSTGAVQLPLRIYSEAAFAGASIRENAVFGLYYGLMLVMILFNALLGLNFRDRTYAVYVGYLLSYLVGVLCLNGNAFRHLVPNSPQAIDFIFLLANSCGWAFALRFSRRFLGRKSLGPRWKMIFHRTEIVLLIAAAASVVAPYNIMIRVMAFFGVVIPILLLVAGLRIAFQKDRPARIFVLAWSTFLAGTLIYAVKALGLLPVNAFTEYATQVGSAIEVTLLSLALADRIHTVRTNALTSKQKLAEKSRAIASQSMLRSKAEADLNHALTTRLFLFGDLAHRVNNPLNIARGAVESLHDKSRDLGEMILRGFPPSEEQNEEEELAFARITEMQDEMQQALMHSVDAFDRITGFVQDLRVIGGVDGESPEPVSVLQILERARRQLEGELGRSTVNRLEFHSALKELIACGPIPALTAAATTWLTHIIIRAPRNTRISIQGQPDKGGNHVWVQARLIDGISFSARQREEVAAESVVMGLLGRKGGGWSEVMGAAGVLSISIRFASNADVWTEGHPPRAVI